MTKKTEAFTVRLPDELLLKLENYREEIEQQTNFDVSLNSCIVAALKSFFDKRDGAK